MSLKEGVWSRQQTLKLITELKKHELLYKVNHEEHLNVYKKKEAIDKIVEALKQYKKNISAGDVKKKIKVMRQQISQEKKKIRAARRSGMSADEVYVPKLWCFKELSFLMNDNDEVEVESNLEINKLDESLCESEASNSLKKAKSSKLDEVAALRESANKSYDLVTSLIKKQAETKEELFCKILCYELKELELPESYESVTTEMLLLVRKAKAEERKKLSCQTPHTLIHNELYSGPSTSTLSEDFKLAAKYYQVQRDDIFKLSINAIKASFSSQPMKEILLECINKYFENI